LSARGTSTLLNNALLSAHFRFADQSGTIPFVDTRAVVVTYAAVNFRFDRRSSTIAGGR
jgi:hypothetical protein